MAGSLKMSLLLDLLDNYTKSNISFGYLARKVHVFSLEEGKKAQKRRFYGDKMIKNTIQMNKIA